MPSPYIGDMVIKQKTGDWPVFAFGYAPGVAGGAPVERRAAQRSPAIMAARISRTITDLRESKPSSSAPLFEVAGDGSGVSTKPDTVGITLPDTVGVDVPLLTPPPAWTLDARILATTNETAITIVPVRRLITDAFIPG